MERHREVRGLTDKGVDPAVRKQVFMWILVLAAVAAVLWASLLLEGAGRHGGVIGGVGEISVREPVRTVMYTEQGWPIIMEDGVAVHPEDLERQG